MRIGFIGLGQMGRGMALRLIERGHSLSVWNRSREATALLAAQGARIASEPAGTLDADIVISMLADDAAVHSVWLASGLAPSAPATSLHVNMASIGLGLAAQLSESHRRGGSAYVSAPVFGRPEAAAKGELDIVAAGPQAALARCTSVFEALGRRWFDLGPDPRHANIVKIARNFVLATIIESLGEAFALVQKSGVAPKDFLDIITATAMSAPAYRNYGRMMLEKPAQPTFSLRLGLKDVELALAAAAESAVPLPSASLLREQHIAAIAHGYGDKDWAELGNWIAERAGCPR
ncbi:MAG: NAD(P)-dependent oxidoreductase [Burkholderiales bacterium]|nr:NAD(P)-dependent oxidoreductase [Burkholderiales bacterium]